MGERIQEDEGHTRRKCLRMLMFGVGILRVSKRVTVLNERNTSESQYLDE